MDSAIDWGQWPTVSPWSARRESSNTSPKVPGRGSRSRRNSGPTTGIEKSGASLVRVMNRRGIKARYHVIPSGGLSAANALLSHASDVGADLVVMGGYSHSRMREIILGGATRNMLENATVPVLMAH